MESNGKKSLFFTKVLDTYEELDDGTSTDDRTYNRDYWMKKSKWTIETAEALVAITQDIFSARTLSYFRHYVAINVSNQNYLWLHKRSANNSLLGFRMSPSLQEEAATLPDSRNISYIKKPKKFYITLIDKEMVEKDKDVLRSIATIIKKWWERDG